jgi:hypothetical protein
MRRPPLSQHTTDVKVFVPRASNWVEARGGDVDRCETFEIAVEQRRLGALSAPETNQLDEHLASCASCRQFADFVGHSEKVMTTADATLNDTDWAYIKKTLRRASTVVRDQRLLHFILCVAAAPLMVLAIGVEPAVVLPRFLAVMTLAFIARVFLDRRLAHQMHGIGARNADFFDRYRAFVKRQVRMLWLSILWFPVFACLIDALGWVLGRTDEFTTLCRGLLVVVAVLVSVWLYRVPLTRYRQIRAQLP